MEEIAIEMKETLITLTSDIVAAHVSHNNVSADDMPSLINNVYGALAGLGDAQAAEEVRPEPAVSVRSSIKRDHVVCLDCGKRMKMLKRHLSTEHDMTPEEYKTRWELPGDYPLVAPAYAETRRDLAKKIGLGRKPGQRRGRNKKVA
ncbi:MAG: MucR family transcriptional regulator [Marinomonas sp.]